MPRSQKELEKALILLINAPADSISAKAVLMRCWGIHCLSHQHQRRALLVRPCERWPFRGGCGGEAKQLADPLPAPGSVDDLCVVPMTPASPLSVSFPPHFLQARSPLPQRVDPAWTASLTPTPPWGHLGLAPPSASPGLRPLTRMRALGTGEPFRVTPHT